MLINSSGLKSSLISYYSNVIKDLNNTKPISEYHENMECLYGYAQIFLKNMDSIIETIESKIFNHPAIKKFIELPVIQKHFIENKIKYLSIDYGNQNFYIVDSNHVKFFRISFNGKNFIEMFDSNFDEKDISINFYYSFYFNLYFNSINSYEYSSLINKINHVAQSKYGNFETVFHYKNFSFKKFSDLEYFVKNLNIESNFSVNGVNNSFDLSLINQNNDFDNFNMLGHFLSSHEIINDEDDFFKISNHLNAFDEKLSALLGDSKYEYFSFIKGIKLDIISIHFKEFCFFVFFDRFKEKFDSIMDCKIYRIKKKLSNGLPLYALNIDEIYSSEESNFTFYDFIKYQDDFHENIKLIEY